MAFINGVNLAPEEPTMNSKNRLDDHLNGLLVAAVVVLSIGLNISVFADNIADTFSGAAGSVRAAAAKVVAPSSQVLAVVMGSQMPR